MKNKKLLYIVIGLLISVVGVVMTVVMFPMNVKNIIINTERDSFASTYFDEKEVNIIADSELSKYKVEIDNKADFEYNIDEEKIEIVKYVGKDSNVVIPEKFEITVKEEVSKDIANTTDTTTENVVSNEVVNDVVEEKDVVKEYVVTCVNLEKFETDIDSIFIPKTVEEIKGSFNIDNDKSFVKDIVIVVIAVVIYVAVILTTSNKNLEENFYNSLIFIFSIIYLLYSVINFYLMRAIGLNVGIFVLVTMVYAILIIILKFYIDRLLNNTDR